MDNRVALVTGASRGLGAAIAERLAAGGHAVAVNYAHEAAGADRVVAAIRAAGATAEAFQADVTDEAAVAALAGAVRERLGPIAVLVVNATGPQPERPAEQVTWEFMLDQLVFFAKSPALLLRAVLPDMVAAGGGRIVHVGSRVVDTAPSGMSAYVAAKSAQLGLARVWAGELGPLGITVNTVEPGWVPVERHEAVPESQVAAYRGQVPLGRMGVPMDVAAAVAFLASDEAAFLTGVRLSVDGGARGH